jgi:predicted oxidoreductase (fatty acid repression mutant protein)
MTPNASSPRYLRGQSLNQETQSMSLEHRNSIKRQKIQTHKRSRKSWALVDYIPLGEIRYMKYSKQFTPLPELLLL